MHLRKNLKNIYTNECSSPRLSTILIFFALCTSIISGCGANVYSDLQSYDPADEAARLLEEGKSSDAIDLLESALEDDSANTSWISMLALAYAQRAGVAPLDFVSNIGTENTAPSGSNEITALFGVTPAATTGSIADVDRAIELMNQIPSESYNDAEKLKLSIFQTAATVLKVKILDVDGDGEVSQNELLGLSNATAESILTGLVNASTLLGNGGADASSGGEEMANQIDAMVSGINAQSGNTAKDKLSGFLQS